MKNFRDDFYNLAIKLKKKEHFAFTRFSDGEMLIMQNRKIVIDSNIAYVHDRWGGGNWGPEEHKTFNPETDSKLRDQLIESFKHVQKNYFKGICCRCCVGEENYAWQFNHISNDEKDLTWANLLINGNYRIFMEQMVPLMSNQPVVMVVNKSAKLDGLPFKVAKEFRVGSNCHINDQYLIQEIHNWVKSNDVKGHLFLFGAASLSNLLTYNLYKDFPLNTYIDIGSTLNPLMGLEGWKGSRDYLRAYWLKESNRLSETMCVW